jgi:hypothetical protein
MRVSVKWYMVILAVVLFGAFGMTDATADTVAFTAPTVIANTNVYPNTPVNLGIVFTANANFSVDALGFYYQIEATTLPETVGLYNSSGTLLASTTPFLPSVPPLVDGYVFQSITPVALTSGDQYIVDAFVGNNPWAYGAEPTTDPLVSFGYDIYKYTNGLAVPNNTTTTLGPAYYGPNFEIGASAVPEPGSLGLLAIALVLTGFLYYRKMLSYRG